MRTILILVLGVGVLAALGIVHFKKRGDQVKVSIDTGQLEDKTEDFIEAVKDKFSDDDEECRCESHLVEHAAEKIEDGVDRARDTVDDIADGFEDRVRDVRRRIER
jgi:hypothetical protein